jgi:hypothetical protein
MYMKERKRERESECNLKKKEMRDSNKGREKRRGGGPEINIIKMIARDKGERRKGSERERERERELASAAPVQNPV